MLGKENITITDRNALSGKHFFNRIISFIKVSNTRGYLINALSVIMPVFVNKCKIKIYCLIYAWLEGSTDKQ